MWISTRLRRSLRLVVIAIAAYSESLETTNNIIHNNMRSKEYFDYKPTRRLDPLDCINEGMSPGSFKRIFRVSEEMYLRIYNELLPVFNHQYVQRCLVFWSVCWVCVYC